jgi:hypothetical protein
MKEKINEYRIDRAVTAGRRKKIDEFIRRNVSRLGRPVSHQWDDSGSILRLASKPVEWEFVFHANRVEAIGSAPLWVKMLFTEKRRKAADEVILQMLEETGFLGSAAGRSGKTKSSITAAPARKKSSSG